MAAKVKKEKAPKEIKAFELTADELKAIKEKVDAEKPEGGYNEAVKKEAVAKAIEFIKNMKQEDVNNYITENVMITEITKAFMAAYIKKFATSEDDKKWLKETFKKASTKIAKKKVQTVCTAANGEAIHKLNAEGKAIVKYVRVDSITGETYETFNLSGARAAFVEYFKITPKANAFKAKEKRKTKVFDEFADLF